MLSAEHRLKERGDFRRCYQKGRYVATPPFVVYSRRTGGETCRIGFSVSKKVGNAVIRNRCKRVFREACRALISHFTGGYDYVIVLRKEAVGLDGEPLRDALIKAMYRVRTDPRRR